MTEKETLLPMLMMEKGLSVKEVIQMSILNICMKIINWSEFATVKEEVSICYTMIIIYFV